MLCFDFDCPADGGDFHRNKGKSVHVHTFFFGLNRKYLHFFEISIE